MNLSPKIIIQYLVPHHILSWVCGKLASCRIKWLKNLLITFFVKQYQIDLTEYQKNKPNDFTDFNDFFTRELKAGMRTLPVSNSVVVSPCDGVISQIGKIENDILIQAKGFTYELDALLASKTLAANFLHGHFATIYLAPSNYHRVHLPFAGRLSQMIYVPGKLFSVNQKTAATIPNLFANNERVIAIFDTEFGKMAVILVGAMIVGSIATVWAGTINSQHGKQIRTFNYDDNNLVFERGAEIGRFQLGSTVIVLFPKDALVWQQDIVCGQSIKMGTSLAEVSHKIRFL